MTEVHTEEQQLWKLEVRSIGAGLVGGLAGGIAMGVFFQLGTDIMAVLGSFLGASSVLRGWAVHLVMSLFLGASFAVVLGHPAIRDYTASFDTLEYVLTGVTYVYAFAAVTVGILPFVFQLPWATEVVSPLFSGSEGGSIVGLLPAAVFALGHLVYGAILGAVYAALGAGS